MASKRANKVFNSIKATPIKMPTETPLGSPGYDNPREDIEKVKKIREGSVEKEPVFENDIVNTHYLDGIINSGLWAAPTLTDEGGLNVSWGTGEVYDHATLSKICTIAGSATC
ncbi:hypothetical protein KA005_05055, partial [bacterium]|nr:hypothetical protein [bacterium]